ncbi:NAD(P)H-hydrate dehydratase [Sphingosinithalassobacter sp. LHW66-3]|uniref:NAD(P)H-hydrate dehydratase n=1 Tax=Sphingosinithalassobacter sp. LHW66-3 TaxID=3424718 RepID=UPI003D6B2F45
MMRIPSGAPILTAAAMVAAEQAVFASGVSQEALMERAGAAVAREAARFAVGRHVLVLAGPGNNGGDAYVVARHLAEAGCDVEVAALGAPKAGAAAAMRARWAGPTVALIDARPRRLLIDGLFGTGMTRPLDEDVAEALARLVAAADFALAIDVPSGLDTDSGATLGAPRGIGATVALGALKPAHLLGDGLERCGHLFLADIGVPVAGDWRTAARPRIAPPAVHAHKYTRGLVVVLEGAMPGAARLAARAALAGGAGYCILTGKQVEQGGPDALVRRTVSNVEELRALLDDDRIAALVAGPGLGRDSWARTLLAEALRSPHPLVLDGDALTLVGSDGLDAVRERAARLWLTPHTGEFDRLFGSGEGSKIERTLAAARDTGATILHKGGDTVVATPQGQVRVLAGASSWLSTAGTGDVLAGLLAAWLPHGHDAAAEAAVWLHGRAAQRAGPAFHADTLIPHIPEAIAECL